MTSLQRVLAALQHREADRVPFFLLLTMHGAKELGTSIHEYFSDPSNVVEGQLRLLAKYGHDCIYAFFYAAIEFEAWGGEVLFFDDGPPNAGPPIIRGPEDIKHLQPPDVNRSPGLLRVLKTLELLKQRVGEDVPIIGVAISPFSLPVMQMGFDRYIELMYRDREHFDLLMRANEEFCVAWANAQLRAGATAICYFDPLASPTNTPRELYLTTGHPVAARTIARIGGPTATHMASGRALQIVDDVLATGTKMLGVGPLDDLAEIKRAAKGKLCLFGNLDGIAMCQWTPQQAEAAVRKVISAAGPGGGFILSDAHGEIPFFVSDAVLMTIADTVRKWGRYPLNGAAEDAN